nr:glycosyltransferase [Acetobacter malorum]
MPDEFHKNVEKLRINNRDWNYIYWNAKKRHDFIYDYYGWDVLKCYLSINQRYGAARADFFRYLCIYQLGGVYLDLKSGCDVPLSNIVRSDDQYLLSQWHNGVGESAEGYGLGPEVAIVPKGEYQQWHIIAAAGHPFLKHVISNVLTRIRKYSENFYGTGKLSVLRVTGPYVYTMSIYEILNKYKHRFIDYEKEGLLYSAVGDHTKVFKKHYSKETSPLIL